ncbi:MAG: ornithine cyclodeaminase family protein [Alphaproteobacteria bacterium]|nr:ornithine cyclodeaminase family protein [Alphaproteobacteria bacterium]
MTEIRQIDAATVERVLDDRGLIDALREMFRVGCTVPVRHHHSVAVPGEAEATLLLMPAWQEGGVIGVKVVNVFPGNAAHGEAAVNGVYLLFSARTGRLEALIDGNMLTLRRTACASALAATYLARPDATHMVMVGTGKLAPHLIGAHASARPIRDIRIWGRKPDKAAALADRLRQLPRYRAAEIAVATDLAAAIGAADVISCATLSATPLVRGVWLKPGAHLDLVGAYTPNMREADDDAVRRAAGAVYVDTRAGATKEGGDIVQPIANGILSLSDIAGDLFDLARGAAPGRRDATQITFFKSVGTALEDLAGARLAVERG